MPLSFPANPTVGQTYTVGTRTWTWDGSIWSMQAATLGVASISTSELADSAVTTAKIADANVTAAKLAAAAAIQPSIVDAKGDLLVGTANDTIARLGVGTNSHVLTADSSTATGLKWAATGVFTQQYDIGDTGPGGGRVFYISPGGFMCGTDGNEVICHYLEAWTTDLLTSGNSATMQWSGNTNDVVITGENIGSGRANTARAIALNNTADRAITVAASFSNNGLSDWFLPSKDELDEMYSYKNVIGGFANANYWSSTDNTYPWWQFFGTGYQWYDYKTSSNRVRPVRCF